MSNTQLVTMDEIQFMGNAVAKSGLFGMKNADQAIALMLIAQAEGMHPAIAARDYHVIQGRPALKADAMLARFQATGGKVNWDVYTDQEVKATFSHPSGGGVTIHWSIDQAKRIGLAEKDNWKNYPRAMLRARVISEGIRTVFPGCVVGIYTPEEVQDFDIQRPPVKDMGNVQIVDAEDVKKPVMSTIEDMPDDVIESWEFVVPNKGSTVLNSKADWVSAFMEMVNRVVSSKMPADQKAEKIDQLKRSNTTTFQRIGLVESSSIYAEIAKKIKVEDQSQKKSQSVQDWADEFNKEINKQI